MSNQPALLSEGVEAVESDVSPLPHRQDLLGGVEPHKHHPTGEIFQYFLTDDVQQAEQGGDLSVGSSTAGSVPQLREIPDSDSAVHTGRYEDVPGLVESQGGHPVLVPRHGGQQGPAQPVPDPDGAVVTGAEQPGVDRVPTHCSHVVSVTSQSESPLVGVGVPEDEVSVGPTTGQQEVFVMAGKGQDRTVVAGQLPGQTGPGVLQVVVTSDITTGEATVN